MKHGLQRWRDRPAAFIERYLHDPTSGRPFVLLPAQKDFLAHAFALTPGGRMLYPELVFGSPKKSGKTSFAAALVLTLILLFGRRYSEALLLANSFEQSKGRVFEQIRKIVECSPDLAREAHVTSDRIEIANAVIRAVASDAGTAAGSEAMVACFDELWAYDTEAGHRLFDECVPPPTLKVACRLTVTYAGFVGESVLLEGLYKRGIAQPEIAPSLHAGDGILCAWHHDPIAPWQDETWVEQMRRTLRPNQFARMIENRWVTSESAFIDLANYDACVDTSLSPVISDRYLPVFVGIDASTKHDSTAVVAVAWAGGKLQLVAHRVFQPSKKEMLDFEYTIEATVKEFASRFNLAKVLFDPWQMQAVAQRLLAARIPIDEFPQTVPNLTAMGQNLYELISGRNLKLYPDASIRLAVGRAVAIETSRGWRISKEKASHKIDVVVALAMACRAAVQDPNHGVRVIVSEEFLNRMRQMPPSRNFYGRSFTPARFGFTPPRGGSL
jgi:phage terminase large subunit-like protein